VSARSHPGRGFGQLSLPVGTLRLKVTKGIGEGRCATVVERSIDCPHHCIPDAGTRFAPEAPDGPADVVEGERRRLSSRTVGIAGRLAGALAGLDQMSFAVELAAVPMLPAGRLVHYSSVAAAGQVAFLVVGRRTRRASD